MTLAIAQRAKTALYRLGLPHDFVELVEATLEGCVCALPAFAGIAAHQRGQVVQRHAARSIKRNDLQPVHFGLPVMPYAVHARR